MELRQLLPRTWYPFLARFPQPRPIQLAAVPPILEGRPVLLASATASGKTEGYLAPLVERWWDDLHKPLLRVVIVSPTRALVNDLFRRLETPLERCGVVLGRRTGDHAQGLEDPPGVLVTTPESLDSMLCRHPRWLGSVGSVVLDELHILAGTPRGSQVRLLLERLDRVTAALGGARVQRVAASATVAWSAELAREFLGEGSLVVQEGSARELDYQGLAWDGPQQWLDALAASQARKVLAFVPSRARAEELAGELLGRPPFQRAVLVHHASLSRGERERVERTFLSAPAALVLATTTLELGLDIGDVDLVVTDGPPPDVSSMLQRAGRANRRSGLCHIQGIYHGPGQEQRLLHLAQRAREGLLLEPRPRFWSSVLVQQAFSLAYQNPGRFLTAAALADRLPPGLSFDPEELLDQLALRGWLDLNAGRARPTQRLEKLYERGHIHGNLDTPAGSPGLEVVDAQTGQVVGQIQPDREGRVPDEVALGGRLRRLRSTRGKQVLADTGEGAGVTRFAPQGSVAISQPLAQDLGAFLGLPAQTYAHVQLGNGESLIGHFQGTARGELLAELVRSSRKARVLAVNGFVLRLEERSHGGPPLGASAERWSELVGKRATKLAHLLGAGPWAGDLPAGWLQRDLEQSLELSQLAELSGAWSGWEPPESLEEVLIDLASSAPKVRN